MASLALTASLMAQTPARSDSLLPAALRGLVVPAGFGVGTFAQTPGLLPTSLTFGPDGRLYVAAVQGVAAGNGPQFINTGQILAFTDLGGVGDAGEVVAQGFDQILGITFGPDCTLYAADNVNNTGRIQALPDPNCDGTFEQRRTVLRNIPNGRHQTNGMTFGTDGMLYVANGNATDDGLDCGFPDEVCPAQEKKPWTGAILRVSPSWTDVDLQADVRVDADSVFATDGKDDESVLVSSGYRNIYDVDFRPGDPTMIYTPMNGSDFPASNEPLYRTDVADTKLVGHDAQGSSIWGPVIDDAGFPSCLYGPHANSFPMPGIETHPHPENFEPEDNPNSAVTDKFGRCRASEVVKPIMFFNEAHNGTSGLAFERGDDFPERYDGDLFVAEWGSLWNLNGAEVTGHKITHVDIGPDGLPDRKREFMTGAVPMDITFGPDGAMYVADFQGLIYRVIHVMDVPDMATIEIQAGQFVPQIVAIPRSASVLWVNLDTVPHNVRTQARILAADPGTVSPVCLVDVIASCNEIDSPGNIPPRGSHRYDFGDVDGIWKFQSTTAATDAGMQGAVIVLPVDR
jgi:glucose/arabinose dehydrogenase